MDTASMRDGARIARILSALLLAVQLFWLAAPALCHSPVHADCHVNATMAGHEGSHALPGSHYAHPGTPVPAMPSCTMPAACSAPVPALAATAVQVALAAADHRVPAAEPPLAHVGDPVSPLVPPPQA